MVAHSVITLSAALALMTVFDDCGNINKSPPPPPPSDIQPDPSGLPACPTDPPYACALACMDPVGSPPIFTDECAAAMGPLAVEFEQQANDLIDSGSVPCVAGQMLDDITPCDLGIMPQALELPPACQLPKPGCKL